MRLKGSNMKQDRDKFIGGSEIASIMGVSRWSSPLKVWAEKTGRLENTVGNLEAVEIGSELEDYVAKRFSRKTGFKVAEATASLIHPEHDFLRGHIDRQIVGEPSLLECKTTSAYNLNEWQGDQVPIEYVLQVNWYLGLAGFKLGYIAVLVGGQKFIWKELRFNSELFDKQVEAAVIFWNHHILNDQPPMATGLDNDVLLDLYPTSTGTVRQVTGDEMLTLNNILEDRYGALEAKKNLEGELETLDAQLKQWIGEHDEVQTDQYRVTWKTVTQSRIDADRLKAEGIYDKYLKVSSYRALRSYDKNKATTKKLKEIA